MERPDGDTGRDERAFESEAAQRRKAAMLPSLLAAVRWRRRRRQAARASAVAAALVVVWFGIDAALGGSGVGGAGRDPHDPTVVAATPGARCEVVRDRPDVVARLASAPAVPDEWWIDDVELQQLLDEDARPSGLVRVAGRVAVTAAAIDPLATLE